MHWHAHAERTGPQAIADTVRLLEGLRSVNKTTLGGPKCSMFPPLYYCLGLHPHYGSPLRSVLFFSHSATVGSLDLLSFNHYKLIVLLSWSFAGLPSLLRFTLVLFFILEVSGVTVSDFVVFFMLFVPVIFERLSLLVATI